jgi:hypothetical protein
MWPKAALQISNYRGDFFSELYALVEAPRVE